MPGALRYCRHVINACNRDGVNGEQSDHGINNLLGELRRETLRDSCNALCGGPSHDSILGHISVDSTLYCIFESSLCPARLETVLQARLLFLLVHPYRYHRRLWNAPAHSPIKRDLPSYINTPLRRTWKPGILTLLQGDAWFNGQ